MEVDMKDAAPANEAADTSGKGKGKMSLRPHNRYPDKQQALPSQGPPQLERHDAILASDMEVDFKDNAPKHNNPGTGRSRKAHNQRRRNKLKERKAQDAAKVSTANTPDAMALGVDSSATRPQATASGPDTSSTKSEARKERTMARRVT